MLKTQAYSYIDIRRDWAKAMSLSSLFSYKDLHAVCCCYLIFNERDHETGNWMEEMAGPQKPKLGNPSQSTRVQVGEWTSFLEKQPGEVSFETLSHGGKREKAGAPYCAERKLLWAP